MTAELLIELFGQARRDVRTTVGVASLPGGVDVELEMRVLATLAPNPNRQHELTRTADTCARPLQDHVAHRRI